MGRKGSWIAAIKKAFSSKEKPNNEILEKKKQKGKTEPQRTIIPIFRQPSSIEKILADVEREQHKVLNRPQSLPSEKHSQKTNVHLRTASSRHGSLRIGSPKAAASPRVTSSNRNISPRVSFQKASSSKTVRNKPVNRFRPEPTLAYRHVLATRIQSVYRGYMARRSFKALRGLVRGQNVQGQTANAMRQMQLMVRVQTQIHSRRIQLLENQALRHHNNYKTENDSFSKWRMASESGNADWEDSVLTKEEIESRMQRKMEAAVKRERAMAYAYSHTQLKEAPKSPLDTFTDHRSGSFPWWWNWLEHRLPSTQPARTAFHSRMSTTPSPQPQPRNFKQNTFESDQHYTKPKPTETVPFQATFKDDNSLNSYPPFSAPSYMAPTASAKAKIKATNINTHTDKQTPSRRFSFPLTQGIGSFKWNKDVSNDNFAQKLDKVESFHSTGNLSAESTTSLTAGGTGKKGI